MRRILVLALLLSASLPMTTVAQSDAKTKSPKPPAKSSKPPKAQTELEKAIAERDRLMKAGKHKEALPWAQKGVEILRTAKPASVELSRSLQELGMCSYMVGDFAATEACWGESHSILTLKATGTVEEGKCLWHLGVVAYDRGDLTGAQSRFERALTIYNRVAPRSLAVATLMFNLGNVARGKNELSEAKACYEYAIEIQILLAPASVALANSHESCGDVEIRRRDNASAKRHFEAALDIIQKLKGDPATIGKLNYKLGGVAGSLGDRDAARTRYTAALEIYERVAPGSKTVAALLHNLGEDAHDRREFDRARSYYASSLEIEEKLDPQSLDLAGCLIGLGVVAYDQDDYDAAERSFESARAIFQKRDPGRGLAISLFNLGNVASAKGNQDRAKHHYEAALALYEKLTPNSSIVAQILQLLGSIAIDQGDLAEAQRFLQVALAIEDKVDAVSRNKARIFNQLARIAHERFDLVEAQQRLEAALAINERFGRNSVLVASNLNNLGIVAFAMGDLDVAQLRYEAALNIHELVDPDSLGMSTSLAGLGNVAFDRRELEKAQRYYEAAYKIREKISSGSPLVAPSLTNLGSVAYLRGDLNEARRQFEKAAAIYSKVSPDSLDVAGCLIGLGVLAYESGNHVEAARNYMAALAIEERLAPESLSVSLTLQNLGVVARARGDQATLTACASKQLGILARLLVRQEVSPSSNLGAIGIKISDAARSLGFIDDPRSLYPWIPTIRGAGLFLQTRTKMIQQRDSEDEQVRKLGSELQIATKAETDWATSPRPKDMAEKAWSDRLIDLRAKRQSAELNLITLLKARDLRIGETLKVELKDVQAAIPMDGVLVEFLRISTWDDKANKAGPDGYGAFIVRREGEVRFVRLGNADDIDKLVWQFMTLVDSDASTDRAQTVGSGPSATKGPSRGQLGKDLYRKLIAPLGKLPLNIQIAPDGSLHGLAFDALQNKSGKYLLELKNVSLVGSGRDLAVKPPTAPATEPVVLGVGQFGADLAAHGQAVKTVAATLGRPTTVSRGNRGGATWGNLPGAVAEAKEVAALLNVAPLLDSEAIEERLLSTKNPRVLHLATHGFSFPPAFEAPKRDGLEMMGMGERIGSADNPMLRSGVVLAGANDEEKLRAAGYQDGWITALDLSLMDLRGTELVVLSACETGLGDVRQTEGVFGLQRALRFAGAQTLVMSLFEVPDESTAKLMANFYGEWKPGAAAGAKQAALRNAKLKLLKDPKTRSPKHWAGFVLLGDR